ETTNSAANRCGQVWTLSTGVALTSWIEPDLTTVSRRWVWPPGPAPIGTPPPAGAAAAATAPGFSATATPPPAAASPPASPPPLAALAALLRSSRWAGMRESVGASAAASPPSAGAAAAASAGASEAAFSRAAWARLRRCSGISVMRSQGSRDSAVLADSPEVDGHEDDDHEGQEQHVQHVPPQERLGADLGAAEQHEPHVGTEDRGVAHHVGTHGDGPHGELVPRQQVAGERQQQGELEQHH